MSHLRTFLAGATTMAAALAAIVTLSGDSDPARRASFDEITVGRINIVEPDGTKRFILSNRAQFPGAYMQGKEKERSDRRSFAGMLFMSEDGTENGGLLQRGSIDANGKIDSGVSLTFDRFRQDQTLQLINIDDGRQMTALMINDVPQFTVTSFDDQDRFREESSKLPADQRRLYWDKLAEGGRLMQNRIWLGNTRDKNSTLQLKDARGRTRMRLTVSADGNPEIQMLDEQGKVVKSITPDAKG